jgi:hypothetical protein
MLTRVDERLPDTGLAESTDDGRGLHEVRPGAEHMRNESLHRCPLRDPTKEAYLANRSGRDCPVSGYRPRHRPRAG